jgi:RHS repeat-associated protein
MQVLGIEQSLNVGFSSDRLTDRFTGKPFSATTGLYYYYHRWCDPSTGRFISPDLKHGHLSNPQSLNLYIYVVDLPTTLKDSSGLDWWNLWSCTPQQQAQAFTIAVIAVSIVVVVATAGVGTPLAAAAIGATIGASTSTAAYTIEHFSAHWEGRPRD